MLRMSGKSRKKSTSKNHSKQMGKSVKNKPEYQEDFNEIILNDLVPEEKRNEFGLDEASAKTPKKKGGMNLNLGLNKKKSPKMNDNKSTDDNKKNSKKSSKEKVSNNTSKTKTDNKKTSPKNGTNKGKTKSQEHNDIKEHEVEMIENPQGSKNVKKSHSSKSKHTKRKRVKPTSEENVEIKENVNRELEEQTQEDEFENEDNYIGFRGSQESIEENQIKVDDTKIVENKFENLVWSEDKFPKK